MTQNTPLSDSICHKHDPSRNRLAVSKGMKNEASPEGTWQTTAFAVKRLHNTVLFPRREYSVLAWTAYYCRDEGSGTSALHL